jgi:hypothetical protein
MLEFLFEFLFQIVFEFLLQIFGELLVELGLRSLTEPFADGEARNPLLAGAGYAVLGLVAGGLSLIFFPRALLRSTGLHGVSLLVTPLLAGLTMSLVGAWRRRRGERLVRLDSFGYAFVFAFGMALVRLLFTK